MTTHIFLALGMWPQVVSQNAIASGPDSSKWRPSHYTSWMQYGLLQEGSFDEANRVLLLTRGNMTSPQRPSWRYHLILMRAQQVVNAERWDDPSLAWTIDTNGLGASPSAMSVFTEGLAALKRGDRATAGRASDALGVLAAEPDTNSRYRLATAIALRQELLGLLQIDAGQKEAGLATLHDATRFEDGLAAEYGPPDIVKPTHELLGEVLLGMAQPRDAQQEFTRALALAPGRSLSLRGLALAARAAGDTAVATRAALSLKENSAAHHP